MTESVDRISNLHSKVTDSDIAIRAELNRKVDEITLIISAELSKSKTLELYLQTDPTLIHFKQQWVALQTSLNQQDATLESLKPEASAYPELARKIMKLQNRFSERTTRHFEKQLDVLSTQLPGQSITSSLVAMEADPYFLAACSENSSLVNTANQLRQKNIERMALDIFSHSKKLFLQLPRNEMLTTKSEQCPNFLKITESFNYLNCYVVDDILKYQAVNARVSAMSQWIRVAEKLHELGDFSSLMSVCSALSYSIPLYRLDRTKAGLSADDRALLSRLSEFVMNNSELAEEIKRRDHQVIPFVGAYRTALERAKAYRDVGSGEGYQEKIGKIADELMMIQAKIKTDDHALSGDCELEQWIKSRTDDGTESKEIQKVQIALAKEREPKDSSLLNSTLYDTHKTCWVAKLQNSVLVNLMLSSGKFFVPTIDDAVIHTLNSAVNKKFTDRAFDEALQNAGVVLPASDLRLVNQENKQLYYRGLIENPVLKLLAERQPIHNDSVDSTADTIIKINQLLRRGCHAEKLIKAAAKLKLDLKPVEADAVLREAANQRARTDLPEVENLIDEVNALLSSISLRRFVNTESQKQLNGYMVLLSQSEHMDATDNKKLLVELTTVVRVGGVENVGYNPFLSSIHRASLMMTRLQALSKKLEAGSYDQELIKKIQTLEKSISAGPYKKVFRQANLAQQWVAANGIPDEKLLGQIKSDAPKLNRFRVRFGLESMSDYIVRKLDRVKGRSLARLVPVESDKLLQLSKTELYPAFDALADQMQALAYSDKQAFTDVSTRIEAMTQAITQCDDLDACQSLHDELKALRANIDLDALRKQLAGLENATTSVGVQMGLCTKLSKSLYGDAAMFNSEARKQAYQEANFRGKLVAGGILTRLLTRPDDKLLVKMQKEVPELNINTFTIMKKINALESSIIAKRHKLHTALEQQKQSEAALLMAEQDVDAGHDETQQTNHSSYQKALKYGLMCAGGVLVGAVAVKAAPVILGVATIKVALGAKVATGAAGFAAGAFGESRLAKYFGLFQSKKELDDKAELAPTDGVSLK